MVALVNAGGQAPGDTLIVNYNVLDDSVASRGGKGWEFPLEQDCYFMSLIAAVHSTLAIEYCH